MCNVEAFDNDLNQIGLVRSGIAPPIQPHVLTVKILRSSYAVIIDEVTGT